MKKTNLWMVILATVFSSCKTTNWELPKEYIGKWGSGKQMVIVRTYKFGNGFTFTRDTTKVSFVINENKTASGNIGNTTFENAIIRKNKVDSDFSGIAYIIECGKIGKIFTADPDADKEVEIWLMPVKKDSLEGELRYTEGWAVFPMASLRLVKKN